MTRQHAIITYVVVSLGILLAGIWLLMSEGGVSPLYGCLFLLPILIFSTVRLDDKKILFRILFGINVVLGLAVTNNGELPFAAWGLFALVFAFLSWRVFKPNELV